MALSYTIGRNISITFLISNLGIPIKHKLYIISDPEILLVQVCKV